jgi:hypothetical protein
MTDDLKSLRERLMAHDRDVLQKRDKSDDIRPGLMPDAMRLIDAQHKALVECREALEKALKWIAVARTDEDNGQEVNDYLDGIIKPGLVALQRLEGILDGTGTRRDL